MLGEAGEGSTASWTTSFEAVSRSLPASKESCRGQSKIVVPVSEYRLMYAGEVSAVLECKPVCRIPAAGTRKDGRVVALVNACCSILTDPPALEASYCFIDVRQANDQDRCVRFGDNGAKNSQLGLELRVLEFRDP